MAVDARQVYRPFRRGVGKTVVELYSVLARRRPDWEFVFLHQLPGPDDPFAGLPNCRRLEIDIPGADRFGLWEAVRLPAAVAGLRADVLHCPANTGPRFPVAPLVLTIQDLIPLELAPRSPDTYQWAGRVRAAARAARRVLAPSEYSKGQLVSRLHLPADKISVIGYAPDSRFVPVTDAAELHRVRAKYGLSADEPYAFGFGAQDPRKNTARLIDAFAALPAAVRHTYRLLLVGVQGRALADLRTRAETLAVADRVLLHGFAAEPDLPGLLSGATALCFPSQSEGFGLPVLDAFACGLPVLTGDKTSLPEVAGDAAVLVDPGSTESVRAGLATILTDEDLRAALRARGTARLAGFTWEKAADALGDELGRAAGR